MGQEMLDDMVDYIRTVRDRPVWQSPPADARQALRTGLPREPSSIEDVYGLFKQHNDLLIASVLKAAATLLTVMSLIDCTQPSGLVR